MSNIFHVLLMINQQSIVKEANYQLKKLPKISILCHNKYNNLLSSENDNTLLKCSLQNQGKTLTSNYAKSSILKNEWMKDSWHNNESYMINSDLLLFSAYCLKVLSFSSCSSSSHRLIVQLEYLGLHPPKGKGEDPNLGVKVISPFPWTPCFNYLYQWGISYIVNAHVLNSCTSIIHRRAFSVRPNWFYCWLLSIYNPPAQ